MQGAKLVSVDEQVGTPEELLTWSPTIGRERALGALVGNAYRATFGLLISRGIPPGGRITVDELSRRLGISQTPLRQALVILESEGLVTKVHFSGYRASELLSHKDLENMFEVRLLLEPEAARLAAESVGHEDLDAMAHAHQEMRAEASREGAVPYGTFAGHDATLHSLIAEASRNEALHDSIARLHAHAHLFRLRFDTAVTHDALDEHAELIAAIAAPDPRRAAATMRKHLKQSRGRLRRAFG